MLDLNQNVETKIAVGPAVDPVSALSVSTMSIADSDATVVIKHNTSVEQSIKVYTFSHSSIASGIGFITLSAATMDTVGQLTVIIEDLSLHLPIIHHYNVLSSGAYNEKYGGTAWASQASAIATEVWGTTSRILTASTNFTIPTASAVASQVWSYPTADTTQMSHIASAVWDTALTGAIHNVATTAGRRLRQIDAAFVVTEGTAQSGGASTITLAAGESIVDNLYQGDRIQITAGSAVGEHGIVIGYTGSSKVAVMSQDWVGEVPGATSEYVVVPADCDIETWQHQRVSLSGNSLPLVDASTLGTETLTAIASQVWSFTGLQDGSIAGNILTSTMNLASSLSAGGATQDQVSVIVTSIFNTYDPPTRTEATTDKTSLIAEFALLNDVTALQVASQVWSYTGSGVAFSTIASHAVYSAFNAASVWNEASRSLTDKSNFNVSVVSTVSDKTGYTIAGGGFPVGGYAAGAITAAAIATDAIGATEISSGANEAIADAILNRDLAGGANANTRGVRNALRVLRNRVDASTGNVYIEDDTTAAWTFITSTVAGNPIVAIDPA